jgi:hypothetical protein
MKTTNSLERGIDFLINRVYPKWRELCAAIPKGADINTFLLAGIYFQLNGQSEQRGGNFFNITPYSLKANQPIRVLEKGESDRPRFIRVWVDSAVGLGDPVLRIGTTKGSPTASGVSLSPGVANEVGWIPASTELWMVTDVPLRVYISEES